MSSRVWPLVRQFVKPLVGDARWDRMREWKARVTTHPALRRADARANRAVRRDAPLIQVISEAGLPHAYGYFLDWLAEHDPSLRERIWLSHLPGSLADGSHVLHAWVQDPVRERDPVLYSTLGVLEKTVIARGGHVIQPARVLSNSRRMELEQRLRSVGLRTPRTVPVRPDAADPFGGLQVPFVVRRDWGHLVPMHLCRTNAEVAACLDKARSSGDSYVASEFIETVSPDGLYRKYRYLMFGASGHSRHLIASPKWEVRPQERAIAEALRKEELEYVNSPCELHDVLNAARSALEFDIAAFDYSYTVDGQPVVWEVNPFPDLSIPSEERAPHLRATGLATFTHLARFYRERLAIGRGEATYVSDAKVAAW